MGQTRSSLSPMLWGRMTQKQRTESLALRVEALTKESAGHLRRIGEIQAVLDRVIKAASGGSPV